MGKSKAKKRFSGSNVRRNPTNLAIATEDELVDSSESVWQRISSQLQSGQFKTKINSDSIFYSYIYLYVGSSEERECGCASISIIGGSPEAADTFIEKKLLRIVAPLMLDENVSVKHAAIGALRNISSIRPDICDQMIQQVKMKSVYLFYHCWYRAIKQHIGIVPKFLFEKLICVFSHSFHFYRI